MKRQFISMLSALAAATAAAATIDGQVVRQQWPWDQKVRIDYRLNCPLDETYMVDVSICDAEGNKLDVLSTSLSGDMEDVHCGEHTIVWDPAAAGFADFSAMACRFTLSPRAPIGPKYLVLDVSQSNRVDAVYTLSALSEAPAGGFIKNDVYQKTKIAFRRISAGSYMMGSPSSEAGRSDNEDLHKVILTNDFYIAVSELTKWQYYHVHTNQNYQYGSVALSLYPIVSTSWNMVRGNKADGEDWPNSSAVGPDSLIGHLRARTGGDMSLPEGYVFDIPTEAQWEYACRAGTETAWNNGTDPVYYDTYGNATYGQADTNTVVGQFSDANLDILDWYICPNGKWKQGGPCAINNSYTCSPNAWGIYSMHGNVMEWTLDAITAGSMPSDRLGSATVTEPRGGGGDYKIVRGGAWNQKAQNCRSASRNLCIKRTLTNQISVGVRLAIVKEVK